MTTNDNRALDIELARLMGWKVRPYIPTVPCPVYILLDPSSKWVGAKYLTEDVAWGQAPHFTESLDALIPVWAEIERRGLLGQYGAELESISGSDEPLLWSSFAEILRWILTRTSEQHTRAAIVTLGGTQ